MFISIPTYAHTSSIKSIFKLLRHVSVFLHHPQGIYKFCLLKLQIITMTEHNTAVCRYGKIYPLVKCGRICTSGLQ